jgi:hypothetical protein
MAAKCKDDNGRDRVIIVSAEKIAGSFRLVA